MSKQNVSKLFIRHERFEDIIDSVNNSATIEELLDAVTSSMRIKTACYHHLGSVGVFDYRGMSQYFAYNLPKSYTDYLDSHSPDKTDPGVQAAFSNGQFMWLSDIEHDPIVVEAKHDKRIKAGISLIGDGLCIPLYGPNNRYGLIILTFGVGKDAFKSIFGYQVEAIAQKLHVRYCLMLDNLQKVIKLSGREAQVLELICFGKTNADIGEILKISPNTVAGYVKQIFLKLQVSDRVSAAMRAQTIEVSI